ncbi:hypothetical protein QTP88_018197 [Uroleucon formosanum]
MADYSKNQKISFSVYLKFRISERVWNAVAAAVQSNSRSLVRVSVLSKAEVAAVTTNERPATRVRDVFFTTGGGGSDTTSPPPPPPPPPPHPGSLVLYEFECRYRDAIFSFTAETRR